METQTHTPSAESMDRADIFQEMEDNLQKEMVEAIMDNVQEMLSDNRDDIAKKVIMNRQLV